MSDQIPGNTGPRPLPRVLAVANQKGGVGKPTTVVNLGACLADLGYRTLIVDLDPQGNASTGVGITEERRRETSMYHVLIDDELPMEEATFPTDVPNLFIVPASLDLAAAEVELRSGFAAELYLEKVRKKLNRSLELSTVVCVMYDARTNLADRVIEVVRENFGDKVCKTVVPRTVRLSEAPELGQPIILFDSSSRGAIAYRELAKEVSGGTSPRTR